MYCIHQKLCNYKFHNKHFSLSLWSMAKLPCLDQLAQVSYLWKPKWVYYPHLPGLYSLSGRTSYRKISWSVEAARFMFRLLQSLLNLTGISAAALPNVRAIESLQHPISRLRDTTRFGGKASSRLVNRGIGCIMCRSYPCKNIRSNQYVYKKHVYLTEHIQSWIDRNAMCYHLFAFSWYLYIQFSKMLQRYPTAGKAIL